MSQPAGTTVAAGTGAAGAHVVQIHRSLWGEVGGVASIALQLAVILLLAYGFQLESAAFYEVILPLACGGFLVHHWLPRRFQAWFFVALSLAGIVLVLGPVAGAWLVGAGLGLIALCHVPVAFTWRVLLVLAAGVALMAMRSAWMPTPWPSVIWPILGSMFMFRLVVYMYDLKHQGAAPPAFTLSYFFCLPNTVFLLFPVIDFQTFRRTYYDRPALDIYGEGVRWIFRGLTHLVLYRLIYQHVVLSPSAVTSTAGIVQYLVGNFGLYLRVSGQFHVITGLLHLFGFRLPESHRFFYLASSFSDLWRRINIYWKDFMQKLVYLPVVFGLKKRGETLAIVLATVSVIAVTWFTHSYQWFWLLGTWLFSATDAAFWGLIGVFLVISTLLEQRRGRVRQLTAKTPKARDSVRLALQTAGMFATMCLLWGMWTAPTFSDFRVLLSAATFRPVDFGVVFGVLAVVALAAWITQRFSLGAPSALKKAQRQPLWQHPLVASALPLGLFWAAGEPAVAERVPAGLAEVALQTRTADLNEFDAEQMQRGYYEEIVGVNRFNGELWEVYARSDEKKDAELDNQGLGGFVPDGYGYRCFKPFVSSMYKGARFSTNRWGFRDKDYEKLPAASTRRVVVLGPSYVMGSGVPDGWTFEQQVEDRLNAEWFNESGLNYELLNFGMPSLSLAHIAAMTGSGRVEAFQPEVVLVIAHMNWSRVIATDLWTRVRTGQPLPPTLGDALPDVPIGSATSEAEIDRLLRPHIAPLARWALTLTGDAARAMGALPVFALIPMPFDPLAFPNKSVLLDAAHEAGFHVIDMQDVFEGQTREELVISNADYHPNVEGHRIVANRLYSELKARPEILAREQ